MLRTARESLSLGRRSPEEISNLLEVALTEIEELVAGELPVEADARQEKATADDEHPALRGAILQQRVRDWLERYGWDVEEATRPDQGWDYTARRGNDIVSVEVKARPHIGAADIAAVAVVQQHFALDLPYLVLVVPKGAMSTYALQQAYAVSDLLSVYEYSGDEEFNLVSGSDLIAEAQTG